MKKLSRRQFLYSSIALSALTPLVSCDSAVRTATSIDPTTKIVPKGSLILHTPWLEDLNGNVVGEIRRKNPRLDYTKCTVANEDLDQCPVVVDRFISVEGSVNAPVLFKKKPQTLGEFEDQRRYHGHDLSHSHSPANVGSTVQPTLIDDNDIGTAVGAAAARHSHTITLGEEEAYFGAKEREYPEGIHEPLFREVNAYYADTNLDVRKGTIVFSLDQKKHAGWRNLTETPVENLIGEDVYDPLIHSAIVELKLWRGMFLKIVECWPSRMAKGSDSHAHDAGYDFSHTHEESKRTSVSNGVGGVYVDKSSKKDSYNRVGHNHDISNVSQPSKLKTDLGPSAPRNVSVNILIATEDDVDLKEGMVIPFIPRIVEDFNDAVKTGWRPIAESVNASQFPLYLSSIDPRKSTHFRTIQGYDQHEHSYEHRHTIRLSGSGSVVSADADNDIFPARSDHTHSILVPGNIVYSPKSNLHLAHNPVHHRAVTFMVFNPKDNPEYITFDV